MNYPRSVAICILRIRPAILGQWIKRALLWRRQWVSTQQGDFYVDLASNFGLGLTSVGGYEPATTAILQAVVNHGDTFVDLGANEGYFSVLAAKWVGGAGRVYIIEPQTRLHAIILKNMQRNNGRNFKLITAGISDFDGSGALCLAPDVNTGSSGLFRATRYTTPTQQVRLYRLSTLFAEFKVEVVDVLKMDIEGFEHEAIMGSPEVFREKRVRRLVVEVHSDLLRRRGKSPKEISDFLISCGYSIRSEGGWAIFEVTSGF